MAGAGADGRTLEIIAGEEEARDGAKRILDARDALGVAEIILGQGAGITEDVLGARRAGDIQEA